MSAATVTPGTAPPGEPPLPPAPNLIDPVVGAARTLVASARVLLPIAIVLEAVKVGAMLGLIDLLGEEPGATIGVGVAAILVVAEFALCTQLVLAHGDGRPIESTRELIARTRPRFPHFAAAYLVSWGLARATGSLPAALEPFAALVVFVICCVTLVAPSAAADATGSVVDALRRSMELARLAPVVVFVLTLIFLWPAWELIDALTDSTVGRTDNPRGHETPLNQWLAVRGTFNLIGVPMIAMTLATFYRQLTDWADRPTMPDGAWPAPPPPYSQPAQPFAAPQPGQPYPPQPYAPPQPGQPYPPQPYAPPQPGQPYPPPDGMWRTPTGGVIPPGVGQPPAPGPVPRWAYPPQPPTK